jgi:Mrp family chromosome partitioning ATPase
MAASSLARTGSRRYTSYTDIMLPWFHTTMKSLAFITQKGGSGKSTLALHIAVAALEDRARVVIVDTDPQQSVTAPEFEVDGKAAQEIRALRRYVKETMNGNQTESSDSSPSKPLSRHHAASRARRPAPRAPASRLA